MKLFNADRLFWVKVSRGPAATAPDQSTMNLYCWRCNGPHVLLLDDVERLVYALATDAADRSERADRVPLADYIPSCYLTVLRWAADSEMYAEWVEQGVECRTKS